jgi:hypothetical protein
VANFLRIFCHCPHGSAHFNGHNFFCEKITSDIKMSQIANK